MLYDAKTPSEYMKKLEKDWRREKLEEIRKLIKSKSSKIKEGIQYKMLHYSDDNGTVFHLNAQKNYVSLYVGNVKKIDPDGSLLEGLNMGKGCIRFTKSIIVADTNIEQFIEKAIALSAAGEDISCH